MLPKTSNNDAISKNIQKYPKTLNNDAISGGKREKPASWMWGPSPWAIRRPLEKRVRTYYLFLISKMLRKFLVCFVSSILHYHSHDPDSVRVGSQNKDISYFWENSDLTEIIYLPPEMAPYSWTHQSWNNKFSRFAKVGIIFIWGSVIQKWDG